MSIGFGFGGGGFLPTTALPAAITTYNGLTTAGQGLPPILASVILTGQGAAIGATQLVSAVTAAYRVSVYTAVSTAGATGTNIAITWNDGIANQTQNVSVGTTLGAFNQSTIFVATSNSAINYSAAATTGVVYSFRIVVERLV